jgi:hypothetical protein
MVHAHEKMITTLDANAVDIILTGSIDKKLKRYDNTNHSTAHTSYFLPPPLPSGPFRSSTSAQWR